MPDASIQVPTERKIQALPESKQRDVLGLVEEFLREPEAEPRTSARPIWEIFDELSGQVPLGAWHRLPVEGAEHHDHYLYGAPKRENS